MTGTTAALREAAESVHAAAQAHKRSANYHRKQASELMSRFARLRAECERHGIVLRIEGEDQGGQGRNDRPDE